MNKNTGNLKSNIGELVFTMTSANHVHIQANEAAVYSISCHVHLIDGQWKLKDYRELYMSRPGSFDYPTSAARRKASDAILVAWAAFVASTGFTEIATAAERGHLEDEIRRADEKIVELEKKLTAARNERGDLRYKLGAL